MVGKIIVGDCMEVLDTLEHSSVDCMMTSPPYWKLRDYEVNGQLGHEKFPTDYISKLVEISRKVRRVLKNTGSIYWNIGDVWCGKPIIGMRYAVEKQKLMIPERFAIAMQEDGWILRNAIIWNKIAGTPKIIEGRYYNVYEHIFFFVKSQKYYFNDEAVFEEYAEPNHKCRHITFVHFKGAMTQKKAAGYVRTKKQVEAKGVRCRDVWNVHPDSRSHDGLHFATYPPELCIRAILASCPPDGTMLDPFSGTGTTCAVAKMLGRNYIGIELNSKYAEYSMKRIGKVVEPMKPIEDLKGAIVALKMQTI